MCHPHDASKIQETKRLPEKKHPHFEFEMRRGSFKILKTGTQADSTSMLLATWTSTGK